ncbi:MAG: HAD family hydrolase [Verrucomicrobia bacterium]|nr:HAD family hydrolase [Verrucomicrobiota bacterium]
MPTPKTTKETPDRVTSLLHGTEEAAFAAVEASREGLSAEEAARRLEKFGPNSVAARRANAFVELLRKFKEPLVIQLMVICVLSYFFEDNETKKILSTSLVGGMVFFSVFLSYFQESRSAQAIAKLQAMVKSSCLVLRDGVETSVPIDEIVPGDVVVLAAGSIIPADCRMIQAKDFFLSQSALTGESMPVERMPLPTIDTPHSAQECPNGCLMGSNVQSGTGHALVLATGRDTQFGAMSARMVERKDATAFELGTRSFVWMMIRMMLIMTTLTFGFSAWRTGRPLDAFLFALTVAIGLTPEMLPMILASCLSKGAKSLARMKVVMKRLDAIQNLGAMDIFCTDKTGTLTQDHIVLQRHVDVIGRDSEDVLRYAWMNAHYQTGLRNLLDRAILSRTDLDVERSCRKVDEIPFDFQRRRMSVIVDHEGDYQLICKGAVEEILAVCDRYQIDDELHTMIPMIKDEVLEEYRSLSAQGFRVIALAYRDFDRSREVFTAADESNLVLLGYLAFFDPPKETAATALAGLRQRGVRAKILTGDNELVSRKVCQDVGMPVSRFMGDGINDVLALKAADVGISVDTAVDVAKESADAVLLEKSLLVLVDGIDEGRRIFCNIEKYIRMGASSNFGNMFSVLGAALLFPFQPLSPILILVNNFIYDFSQTAIPFDRVEDDQIAKPRQWNISGIRGFMLWLGPVSSLFDYLTFALMWFFVCPAACGGSWSELSTLAQSIPNLKPGDLSPAQLQFIILFHTGWFIESIVTQTLVVHVIRSAKVPFFGARASWQLSLTTLLAVSFACWLTFSPWIGGLGLNGPGLGTTYWLALTAMTVAYVTLAHLIARPRLQAA